MTLKQPKTAILMAALLSTLIFASDRGSFEDRAANERSDKRADKPLPKREPKTTSRISPDEALINLKNSQRRALFEQLPNEYEQGKVDTDGRYRRDVAERIQKHQEDIERVAGRRVSYQDFINMNDEQIQNVSEVVISLEDVYFIDNDPRGEALNRQLEKNPNITVILDCGNATEINDRCLANISQMRKLKIHGSNVTDIGGHFLSYCYRLTTLDLKSLSNVRRIGIDFLSHCSGLTALDLSPLLNVREIGESFLYRCSGLTTLNLRPLSNVREIDRGFLSNCSRLETLDLRPLSNITEVGEYFLSHCFGLTTLDLQPLSNVREIGSFFLSDCFNLRELDLRPLSNVREIGECFLSNCSDLTTLDLRPLSNVTDIGGHFLYRCSGLTTLDLSPLSNVRDIRSDFLAYCSGLTTLDLRPLSNVTEIGWGFLDGCSGLTQATVTVPTNWPFMNSLSPDLRPRRQVVAQTRQDDFSVAQTQSLLGRVDPMDDSQTRAENLRLYQAQQAQAEVLRNSPEEESVHEESISEKISSEELRIITNVAREAHRRDINTFDEFYRLYETRANAAKKTPLDKVTAKKVLDEQGMLDAFRDPPQ